ncbi:MAG TPA: GNAT family N-acetyltransferase, partial [Candidatus Bathyarchaeia archaeon]|nr:GNAT family N-acetyltransferase [Candidatus Bathyarchaeia archaeon]
LGSPLHDQSKLASSWEEPNIVQGEEILVAELDRRVVGCATIQDRGSELELVNIDVPRELQGRGIGTTIVRAIEERARMKNQKAVTLGTSRNAEGVAWTSLPWWEHLGYRITHEEENEWTRKIGPGTREIRMRKDLD